MELIYGILLLVAWIGLTVSAGYVVLCVMGTHEMVREIHEKLFPPPEEKEDKP